MKKLALVFGLVLGIGFTSQANKYKLDDQKLDQAFETSKEISFTEMYGSGSTLDLSATTMGADATKTRGGYLVRSFFCGFIALHRYYMGTTKGYMWALYFCVPVVGGVAGCVDFWGAVFVDDFYLKYENNDKYLVFLD